METNYCVYKITNLINNKIYIGKDRYDNPKYMGSGKILKLAYEKYGIENFKKEIICYCETEDEYNEKEIFYISEFNSFAPNGYNINTGGKGGDNFKHHPDQEKVKQIFFNLKKFNIGRKASEETKKRMSEFRKNKKIKPCLKQKCEHCEKEIDIRNYHKWHGDKCIKNPKNENKKRELDGKKIVCSFCQKEIRVQDIQFHFEYCKENPNKIKKIVNRKPYVKKHTVRACNETPEQKKERYRKVSEKLKGRETSEKQKETTSKRMLIFWDNKENKKHKCEHCGKETTKVNYIRWHGDNCKNK